MAFSLLSFLFFIFFFAASAISPAYVMLQHEWHFNNFQMTVATAGYSLPLLGSLLLFGPMSDYIGRKPLLLAGLIIQTAAMLQYCNMDGIDDLIMARVVQGVGTGIINGALAAAIIDHSPINRKEWGPFVTGLSPLLGLSAGAILSGLALHYSNSPIQILFGTLACTTLIGCMLTPFLKETVTPRPGALRSMIPSVKLSKVSREVVIRSTPILVMTWATGCLYLAFVPSIFSRLFDIQNETVMGLTIGVLYGTAALSTIYYRSMEMRKINLYALSMLMGGITLMLISELTQYPPLFYLSTVITGFGFGGGFSTSLRDIGTRVLPHERAAAYAVVFIISYFSFALTALIAGYTADLIGLINTTMLFDCFLMVVALLGVYLQTKSRVIPIL